VNIVSELPVAELLVDCQEEYALKFLLYVKADLDVFVTGHLLDVVNLHVPALNIVDLRLVIFHEEENLL
jgi:hypothetical protein